MARSALRGFLHLTLLERARTVEDLGPSILRAESVVFKDLEMLMMECVRQVRPPAAAADAAATLPIRVCAIRRRR